MAARPADQRVGGGPIPTSALHDLLIRPVPVRAAKTLLIREHYLHSMPGGTQLAFGVQVGPRLLGTLTFGVGPKNGHRLIEGATPDDVITLSRLWLSDHLPANSESRVLAVVLRSLRKHTTLRFVLTYADPAAGHVGVIYQATGWLYTGTSEAMPLLDLGDGIRHHSRSLAHAYGTHSRRHFARHGVSVQLIEQAAKFRYLFPLDPTVRDRLTVPVLPYPKREAAS